MSERKVLNKYYPPDFDPSKIPRLRLPRNRQYTVRIMAPCNMRCNTCHDYIARGKKFNARKETVDHEDYLGLKVFRFYFKCPKCMQEITFKTDPKNYDYVVEHGATPNFKALKLAEQQAIEEQKEKEEEERLNPMKLLENRTKASRREMENLEALEDLKEMNQREVTIDYDELLQKKKEEFEAEQERIRIEEEEFVQSIMSDIKQQQLDVICEDGNEEDEIIEEIDDLSAFYPSSKSKTNHSNEIDDTSAGSSKANCTDILNGESSCNKQTTTDSTNLHKIPLTNTNTNNNTNKRKLLKDVIVIKRKPIAAPQSISNKATTTTTIAQSTGKALSSLCTYSDSDSD